MRLYHPRSTLTLILFGFGVVALPLLVALGYAAVYVDRLSEQARTTVYSAAQAIQGSRSLSESLVAMERTARQYLLLDDPALYEVYRQTHRDFQSTVDRLSVLTPEAPFRDDIRAVGQSEQDLFDRLSDDEARAELTQEEVADIFIRLAETAESIRIASNQLIDREVSTMQATAARARQVLFWLAVALIPLTVVSASIFTVLISRPIRQLDRAIRQLGDADFSRPVRVSGPEDLRALGERLEWLRQRLVELENEKTRFLRHISHELKTPLTSIRESSDLLGDEVVGPLNAEQREITTILHESGRRLQALIEDLLDFSRTQGRRPPLDMSQVDVNSLVESVLQAQKPAVRAKSVRVDARLTDCELLGDREKLRTVVDNLLSNAVKFSPEGGTLTVRTLQTSATAVIDVADDGPGIPPEERDRIFDAFFQGRTQPEGYVKGSGLGLAIAREYVVAHDGRIDIIDTREVGTRFRVMLPRTGRGTESEEMERSTLAGAE